MTGKELRDPMGRLLGRIVARSNGVLEGRDALSRSKGTYDPRTNETRDTFGRLIGRGDQLLDLILK